LTLEVGGGLIVTRLLAELFALPENTLGAAVSTWGATRGPDKWKWHVTDAKA